jgi:adenylylsulfate kinase-like enzyme
MHSHISALWFFGQPCSGKTTLAQALRQQLQTKISKPIVLLDGDQLRRGLCQDLGFSFEDRSENVRRTAQTAHLLAEQGVFTLCSLVTPSPQHRLTVRSILGQRVRLVQLHCDSGILQTRAAIRPQPPNHTAAAQGMPHSTIEDTREADLRLDTGLLSIPDSLHQVLTLLGIPS